MKILITGGAGYIGTELIYAFENEKSIDEIIIYDNLSHDNYNLFLGRSKLKTNKIRFVKGDILDSRKLKKLIDEVQIVYHLAAKVTTPFADHNPHEFDQVNNWGTAELCYLIENSTVEKLIYASSVSVYGASSKALNIDTKLNPKTFYGISKMHGEAHVLRLEKSPVQIYNLRLGNVYGYSKSMRFDSVINKFMFEANFSRRLRIFGDGNQMRSFVHIDRLSQKLKNICTDDNLKPGTYNIVENSFSINDIVDELKYIYPDLEMIFVNQNAKMRSLLVNSDSRIDGLLVKEKDRLKNDLMHFKSNFSY